MSLSIGQQAPDFELRDQHGQFVRLSHFRGEKAVVLVFYPFAFSGVCTGELCALRDALPTYQNERVQLLAISCDPTFALRVFADGESLGYPLLSDFWPHGAVAQSYGVFNSQRGCAERGTFVIGRDGVLRWSAHNAIPDARSLADYEQALARLAA